MMLILCALALAMLWSGQPSAVGRALRRGLVEAPAAWLSRRSRWQLGAMVVTVVALGAALVVFEGDGEGLRLAGSGIAEGAGWFIAFDMGTWIEAYAVVLVLGMTRQARAAVTQARALVLAVARRVARMGGSGRRRTPKRLRGVGRRKPPAEPEGWPGLAMAA